MLVSKKICDGISDEEIIRKSLAEVDYFSCLYQRYEGRLLVYIKQLGHVSAQEAEDILQESFIKIWRNLHGFDPSMKLSSWMYRIVHNQTISVLRKQKSFGKDKWVVWKDSFMSSLPDDSAVSFLDEDPNTAQLTREILQKLPLPYREVLILRYLEKMSYDEISDILKLPEGTVATRIKRAKTAFARLYSQAGYMPHY